MALDCRVEFDLRDVARFEAALLRAGELPRKVVTKAAGKGATVAGKAISAAAPRGKTKQLSKGFKRRAEKSRLKGKKVYYYAMDSAKNDIFQKPIPAPGTEHPGTRRTKWSHAYYPASIEYGFLTRSKGGGLSYVQGTHFVRKAAEQVKPKVNKVIIQTLTAELEKEWTK